MRMLALDGFTDLAHLEIVEPELCELQVELAGDAHSADALEVLDGSGAKLELHEVNVLVLHRVGQEVLCVPLQLEPGQRVVQRL